MTNDEPRLLDMAAVAEVIGVKVESVRRMRVRAERNRRAGQPRPGDLPVEDATFGQTPVWRESTIAAWQEQRPGRGVGGGRPPKSQV